MALVAAAACASAPSARTASSPTRSTPPSTTSATPPGSAAPPPRQQDLPVHERTVDVTDRRAAQPARGSSLARAFRVLPTTVWYPASAPSGRRCPLVVFAHGFDARPSTYARLLRTVAAAGYVVAAPLFPISGSGLPGPPREDDMANQALDLRAVITAVTTLARPGQWLAGTIDPTEVAVAGHSDGAETAAASVLVRADEDRRISAAVLFAGQLPTWGEIRPVAVPTLVVQGDADTVNPPQLSRDLFDRLRPPKAYLDVVGAGHLQRVTGADPHARAVAAVFIDFLDLELRHHATASAAMRRDGHRAGRLQLLA